MIIKNEIKRRKFLGYILGGMAGGFISANPSSLIARVKKVFKSEKKIVVRQNALAIPRKKDETP